MRFCALWLLIGPHLPLLSRLFMPDFIAANVLIGVAFCGPKLAS